MQSQQHNQIKPNESCKRGWTDDEKRNIAAVVYPLAEMQKAYGRSMNAQLVMQGWEGILAKKYNGDQIVYALEKYAL